LQQATLRIVEVTIVETSTAAAVVSVAMPRTLRPAALHSLNRQMVVPGLNGRNSTPSKPILVNLQNRSKLCSFGTHQRFTKPGPTSRCKQTQTGVILQTIKWSRLNNNIETSYLKHRNNTDCVFNKRPPRVWVARGHLEIVQSSLQAMVHKHLGQCSRLRPTRGASLALINESIVYRHQN